MGWKYIMMEKTTPIGLVVLWPIIFPDKMVHSDVFVGVRQMVPPLDGNWPKAVSAGMIEHIDIEFGDLHGESETLRVKSRDEDRKIINGYSYFHGIKT